MAEEKRKRLDTGRALFDTYLKKKHESPGQSSEIYSAPDDNISLDGTKPFIHLDAVTLVRRKEQFDSLDSTIKKLQESLSEKEEIITSLEIQNKILREGEGDHANIMSSENNRVRELTKMLEARNNYIGQLSDSLLHRNEELKTAYNREKELTLEIDKLQQDICVKTKASQSKLMDSYNENIEYKAKVNILTNKVEEYSNLVKSLKASNDQKQEELVERSKKHEQDKSCTSKDIQALMRKIEEQNKIIDKKEKELIQSKMELENIRAIQEDEFKGLKKELEKKYQDDIGRVEKLYDEMMLKHLRNSEMNLSGSETCDDIEKQLASCNELYEKDLRDLLARNKFTEDQLQCELKKYKDEAECYKRRVETIANDLSTETNRLKYELKMETNKYQVEMEGFKKAHAEEINKLSKLLSDSALVEAQKDVEIETYKRELNKCDKCIDNLSKEMNLYKQTNEQLKEEILDCKDKYKHVNERNQQLSANVSQFKKNESRLLHKVNLNKSKMHDNEAEIFKLREQLRNVTNEYAATTQTFEEKLGIMKREVEDAKAVYESKILQLTSKISEQQNLIKHLQGELVEEASFNEEESTLTYNEINQLKKKLAFAIQKSNDIQIFLWELLKGLREIKIFMKNMICTEEDSFVETVTSDEIVGNMSYEVLIVMLQKTLQEILELSQSLQRNVRKIEQSDDTLRPASPRMVTSTPIVKQTVPNDYTSLMRKCTQLEKEKDIMSNQLELLNENIKQMEFCLNVATEESGKFNKKCQILDKKLTELENSRSSDNLLAKENNDLKEKLRSLEESKLKLQRDVTSLSAKNVELEEILNRNVTDLYKKLSEDCIGTEFADVLNDLKGKSGENVELKSQLYNLQQCEQDNKVKIASMQTKLNKLNTEHISLKKDLDLKMKDLENLKLEKNKLSSENQLLQAKILTMQQKFKIFGLKSTNSALCNDSTEESKHPQLNNSKKDKCNLGNEMSSTDKNVDKCSLNRMQTLHMLSAGRSFSNVMSKPNLGVLSVYDTNDDHLQLIDKGGSDLDFLMPTIPEEDHDNERDSLQYQKCSTHGGGGDGDCLCVLAPRCAPRIEIALRHLLSALFDEYTHCVKKLLLPWKEECETLDFNLQKWLNINMVQTMKSSAAKSEAEQNKPQVNGLDVIQDNKPLDTFNSALENCVNSFLLLKSRLIKVHDAVLKVINVQKEEVKNACVIGDLQEKVEHLQTEIQKLEKNHKSAIELLVKDHESELGLVNKLLTQVQVTSPAAATSPDCEAVRRQLEQKHEKDLEELRMYFEKKCADLEKHYSEDVYSQSCKVSDAGSGSSSELDNMGELFATPDGAELPMNNEDCLHEDCEKKMYELKRMLEEIKNSHKTELESIQSKYIVQLSESLCKLCKGRNLMDGEQQEELGRELDDSDSYTSNEIELKMFQIKEEVRREYENELEKIRSEIIEQEMKRKDEDINMIKSQLNEAHKIEIDKLWQRYRELANKEVENSVINVKKEVILSQELEDKENIIKQLKSEKNDLVMKLKQWNEQKDIELKRTNIAHQKEIENLKEALEIELSSRIKSATENRNEEENLRRQIEHMKNDNERLRSEIRYWQDGNKHELTENVRKEILCSLEQQIKVMVASGEEGEQRSEWPPELTALERQFTSKYQHQLAQLVEEHALEIAEIKGDYNTKLTELVKAYSIREAEEMPSSVMSGSESDVNITKLINERDNLRGLAQTLGRVVRELAQYISSCEDELNRSLVSQLIHHKADVDIESSESEELPTPEPERKVHFAPDVTTIVSLTDEDCLLDVSADLSVFLRAELESCLQRLRTEATAVLGLTQKERRRSSLLSAVEDRRLSSMTRQLVEEKKAKEEANKKLQNLQELVEKYEQELNDVHKELQDTKERMIKDKVSIETELAQRQAEAKVHKLDHLQERARALIVEKGWVEGEGESECPPPWLGLIELLCAEGDEMIEDAVRAKEELELQVDAADKQLRCTRAFLEEQAAEREQERDEFSKEIARLADQLRERDKDWTAHKNFANELAPGPTSSSSATSSCTASLLGTIDTLELQVKETTELLKDTEEKKEKVEKELKAAVDKIWVLRDIISELEVQVSERCERERGLEQRLAELECELETQARGQADLLAELRVMQANEPCGEALRPPSPLPLKSIRAQLKGMVKSMDRQTRELETVNIHTSCTSLSSPSEDVSIREQFEAFHSHTPEDRAHPEVSSSPSTGDVVAQLNERLLRHWRATDNVVKQLRDRDMEIARMKTQLEETTAERDVLQGQSERQLMQVAALRNRVEELRVRNEREVKAGNAPLHQRIQELEGQAARLNDQLTDCQRKLTKTKQKLDRAEVEIRNRETELGHLSEHQHELVIKLQQDLKTMNAEKKHLQEMVEKYRKEENVSLPQLVEVMLAEKNADIDHLQRRVDELQSQQEEMSSKSQNHSKSRGLRVSFADEVTRSQLHEDERARDIQRHHSTINAKAYFSTPLSCLENGDNRPVPRVIADDISKITEPSELSDPLSSSPVRAVQLESVLSKLKSELEQKTEKLELCETQRASLEEKLSSVREQLKERDGELTTVRTELREREEEVVRTRADLKALQLIMEGFQQKLQEAKVYAGSETSDNESVENKVTKSRLEEQLQSEIASRQLMQDMIDKLEKDKQNIISELAVTKSKSKSLQDELEEALSNATEFRTKIESLSLDLEASEKEKKRLNANCQKLKKELDGLTKKQKSELKNILKKDSEEVLKMRNEITNLKINNSELQSECEKLQQELNEVGNSLDLLKELNIKDDKIQQMENNVKRLEDDNKMLKMENVQTEHSLNMEIAELKVLMDDLNKNIKYLELKKSEESMQYNQKYEFLVKKYETLKREYDRQRRARRESEKKCSVLKDEIMKEKSFSAELQSRPSEKYVPKLDIIKKTLVDITSGGTKLSSSLDNLTDEVQKELNRSAQLDQSLISGIQQTNGGAADADAEIVAVPCKMCGSEAREQYLRSRLAELEMSLNVERVVVSELRSRLIEERQRYMDERTRAHQLAQEVTSLHVLNDQFQDRLNAVVQQLEKQSQLRQPEITAEVTSNEREKFTHLLEGKDGKIDDLLKERAFLRNELTRLKDELANREVWTNCQEHGRGDNIQLNPDAAVVNTGIQTSFELRQPPLGMAVGQINDLERKLNNEESQRKALESKLKAMELAERSRHSRRKATEEQLKNMISLAEKGKKDLEQECLNLRLRLRQRDLQLSAHTAESPLSLRLAEANMAVERLVGEKEDLNSANLILQEEKNMLQRKIQELQSAVDGLKSQIDTLKIRVTDGGVDNQKARFSEERAAWQEERRRLETALSKARSAQKAVTPYTDFNTTDVLERYLRSENHRKALVWQKRFLQISLEGYQKERKAVASLGLGFSLEPLSSQPLAKHRFRVAAHTVRAVSRLQFLVERRRRTHANTCRLLSHALTSARVIPLSAQNVSELQTLWQRPNNAAPSCVGTGSLSQYLDRFHNLQDRIRDSLTS